jgi:pimeloyl-ACP methyl ester carboxylesterase
MKPTPSDAAARSNKSTTVRSESTALRALRGGLGMLSRVSPRGAARVAEHLFLSPRRYARPAHELEALASARRVLVPTPHGALSTWEWGDEGPRVLLVHGWEGRGAQLAPLVAPLLGLGFRVVAFDAPGHGDSPGEVSSLVHFAESVQALADTFGPLHAIVTHSMGGAATAWAFRHHPLARRLVMICPPVDLRDFTRQMAKTLALGEDVRAHLHTRLADRFGVEIEALRVESVAPHMTTPLLVVHDEDDREVPIRCGELVARSWPGATLVRTRGLGHRRILKDDHVVRAVVRFVAEGAPSRRAEAA